MGGPEPLPRTVEGLLSHTTAAGDCRRWKGAHDRNGYGRIAIGRPARGNQLVHRLMHQLAIGPIPDGHEVDHVRDRGCVHRDCIWPAHLEAVTPRENALRAVAVQDGDGTCRKGGHPMTADNVYITPTGGRRCITCVNARKRRDYAAKKETVHA